MKNIVKTLVMILVVSSLTGCIMNPKTASQNEDTLRIYKSDAETVAAAIQTAATELEWQNNIIRPRLIQKSDGTSTFRFTYVTSRYWDNKKGWDSVRPPTKYFDNLVLVEAHTGMLLHTHGTMIYVSATEKNSKTTVRIAASTVGSQVGDLNKNINKLADKIDSIMEKN